MQQQASSNNTSVYSSFGKAGEAIINKRARYPQKKKYSKKIKLFFKKIVIL
jgi:hypothetical protein